MMEASIHLEVPPKNSKASAPCLGSRISVPEHVLVQKLNEEVVLLHLASERYYSLDDVGTRMWETVTTEASVQEAFDILMSEYDVAPEQLERDLLDLLTQLAAHTLVEIHTHSE